MRPHPVGDRDEDFKRRIAGARAHAGKRTVDARCAVFDGDEVKCDAEPQIVMRMHAGLGCWIENIVHRLEPVGDAVEEQGACAVGDVDAVRAIALHQLGLFRERLGLVHVGQHQQAGDIHPELARDLDMLLGDIGFGAVGGDPDRPRAGVVGVLEIFDRADAGQQKNGKDSVLDDAGCGFDPFEIGMGAEPVIERRAGEPVAVRDLDPRDARLVECTGDFLHLLRV